MRKLSRWRSVLSGKLIRETNSNVFGENIDSRKIDSRTKYVNIYIYSFEVILNSKLTTISNCNYCRNDVTADSPDGSTYQFL